jgi:hypothetical protein
MGRSEGKRPLERPGIDGRIILKWIFKRWGGGAWTELIWLSIGKVAGACECSNEHLGSIKCGEFLDCLRKCLLQKKHSVPWS